jgi:arylsulfatase A-like enzyme
VQVKRSVSTVGTAATILDLAGIAVPASFQVRSLIPVIEGRPGGGPALAERFTERSFGLSSHSTDPLVAMDRRYRSYRSGALKLYESSRGGARLFDLSKDPGELTDVSRREPRARKRVQAELHDWRSLLGLPDIHGPLRRRPIPELDPAARERLRQLGYIE